MDHIAQHSQRFGFKMNVHKTKQKMDISKNIITGVPLYVNQTRIERVKQYCYLENHDKLKLGQHSRNKVPRHAV
jgi:hypothetical protein